MLMIDELTRAQELHIELIRASGQWNCFDGPAIADALLANREMWRAVLLWNDFVPLSHLAEGHLCADTMYILATPGLAHELCALASTWGADELDWMPAGRGDFGNVDSSPDQVLRLWWD